MARKELPLEKGSRVIPNSEIITIKPSDVLEIDTDKLGKLEKEIFKKQTENLGKGLDVIKNIVSLADKLLDIRSIKEKSETELKKLEKYEDMIRTESEMFIKIEQEKRKTIVIENKVITDLIDTILKVAENNQHTDELKKFVIENFISAAKLYNGKQ